MSSTKRVQSLTKQRKAAGWSRLNGWIEPEPTQALARLCADRGLSAPALIAALLLEAAHDLGQTS